MYTPEMEKAVREAAPLNLEKAKSVGEAIGMSYRSVIAKAKQLGVEYVSKPAPARKTKEATKAELVGQIEKAGGFSEGFLEGLEKAPKAQLAALLSKFEEE